MNKVTFSNTQVQTLELSDTDSNELNIGLKDSSIFSVDRKGIQRVVQRIFAPKVAITVDAMKNRIVEIIDMGTEEVIYTDYLYRHMSDDRDFLELKRKEFVARENQTNRYALLKDDIPGHLQEARGISEMEGKLYYGEMELLSRCIAIFQAASSVYYTDDFTDKKFRKILSESYEQYMRVAKLSNNYSSYEDFQERVAQLHATGL